MRSKHRIVIVPRKKPFVLVYKDPKQRKAEEKLKAWLCQYAPKEIIVGPVMLFFTAFMPITKTDWKSKKRRYEMINGKIKHIKKPDLDNLEKHLKDCLQDIFVKNDSQVYSVVKEKKYAEYPGWKVTLIYED